MPKPVKGRQSLIHFLSLMTMYRAYFTEARDLPAQGIKRNEIRSP